MQGFRLADGGEHHVLSYTHLSTQILCFDELASVEINLLAPELFF